MPGILAYGRRECARCRREFVARTANQRFCSERCKRVVHDRGEKYANPAHRGRRRALTPLVASGQVRCARGAKCKWAEWVDEALVGGFIRPGQPWDLGHPDGESPGGPEHAVCNRAAPSRLRGKRR